MMKIHKILNNNCVIILDQLDHEVIVMGKGIAYQKKIGDEIEDQQIDKRFSLTDKNIFNRFQELLTSIPVEYFVISNKIIEDAKRILDTKLNESIYISLSDHIFSALVRQKQGIEVKNVLLWDIKRFYSKEYEIALRALAQIKLDFDITFPEDEAGFIALHIVNAQSKQDAQDSYLVTKVMDEVCKIVKYYFKIIFDEQSVSYYRFITHLKFFAQRLASGEMHVDEMDDLLDIIKVKYQNAFLCVEKIASHIKNNYQYQLSDSEKLYLTVHIHKVVYMN